MTAIDEVRALDQKRIRAMINKDIGALDQILADDLVYTHPDAKKDNKASLIDALLSGAASYRQIDVDETDVRDFGDAVVLIGKADMIISEYGERRTFGVRFTTVYARRGGRWQMAVGQSTKSPS